MKCPFACVSKAYHTKDEREPIAGIRNLAGIAHKHHIPVTWILTEQAAEILRDELVEWNFPETAHYSDSLRYCTFAVGNPAIRLIRYDQQQSISVSSALVPETNLPGLKELRRDDNHWGARIIAPEAMPYALALQPDAGEKLLPSFIPNRDLAVWPLNLHVGEHCYNTKDYLL